MDALATRHRIVFAAGEHPRAESVSHATFRRQNGRGILAIYYPGLVCLEHVRPRIIIVTSPALILRRDVPDPALIQAGQVGPSPEDLHVGRREGLEPDPKAHRVQGGIVPPPSDRERWAVGKAHADQGASVNPNALMTRASIAKALADAAGLNTEIVMVWPAVRNRLCVRR